MGAKEMENGVCLGIQSMEFAWHASGFEQTNCAYNAIIMRLSKSVEVFRAT